MCNALHHQGVSGDVSEIVSKGLQNVALIAKRNYLANPENEAEKDARELEKLMLRELLLRKKEAQIARERELLVRKLEEMEQKLKQSAPTRATAFDLHRSFAAFMCALLAALVVVRVSGKDEQVVLALFVVFLVFLVFLGFAAAAEAVGLCVRILDLLDPPRRSAIGMPPKKPNLKHGFNSSNLCSSAHQNEGVVIAYTLALLFIPWMHSVALL